MNLPSSFFMRMPFFSLRPDPARAGGTLAGYVDQFQIPRSKFQGIKHETRGILIALAVFTTLPASGQVALSAGWYAVEMMEHPVRKHAGAIVDLRPLFNWHARSRARLAGTKFTEPNPCPDWLPVSGKVISITATGVLVDMWRDDSMVFVRGAPRDALITDALVKWLAVLAGTYEYTAVSGARRVVPMYDYGTFPDAAEIAAYNEAVAQAAEAVQAARTSALEERRAYAEKRTVESLLRRVEQGSLSALHDLGLRHLEGKGVDLDPAKGRELIRQSAAAGYTPAKHWLAKNP